MALLQTGRKRLTPIGLDAGSEGLRAVQMRCEGGRYTAQSVIAHAWPGGDGSPPPWGEQARHFRSYLSGGSFSGRRAILAFSGTEIDYFSLDLPSAVVDSETSDVSDVVRWEVARLMGGTESEVETRHWLLPSTRLSAPNAMGVAVRQEVVCQAVGACRAVGLVCESADVGAAALARFGVLMRRPDPQEVWGLLDVGGSRTRLILCLDDVPVLVRHAGAGGRAWTERVVEALPLSTEAAEMQKCEHGIARATATRDTEFESPARHEVASIVLGAIRADLHDIASEVKRSYEYVLSCYPGRHAGDLMLVGGGAAMRNLPGFLADALGIAVHKASDYLGEPSCRLMFASGKRHRVEQVASAIGAAINE